LAISIADTISRIYDSACHQSSWQGAIDSVVDLIGAKAGALLIRDFGPSPYSVNALSSAYMNLMASGQADYYMRNLSHFEAEQWDFISQMQPGAIARDEDMGICRDVLDGREDYVFLREQAGTLRRLAVRLNDDRAQFDGMTIGFPYSVERVPDVAVAKLSLLLPHLAKAVELDRTFRALRQRYNAALAVLDKISIGIFLVLENGQIFIANHEANRILSLEDGLVKKRGILVAGDHDTALKLSSFIADVARTAAGNLGASELALSVPRPSKTHPFLVEVAPIRDSASELDGSFRGAMVVVVDPERTDEIEISTFGILYGLTKAEVEVCKLLLNGYQAGEIAAKRGTRLTTSKNQIASIYHKTGVGRRGELIRLIVKAVPPLISGDK